MSIFDPDQLRTLAASYSALQRRLDSVAEAYAFFPYKTQQGGQYATHGFLRRFNTMHHCIERVFAILPRPNRANDLPILFCWTLPSTSNRSL